MPQIQAPELAEALRRKFSIVGGSPIDTIAPELVGVVVVDVLLPRLLRLDGCTSARITGDTGDIPEIRLRNLDPIRQLIVDRIILTTSSANTVVRVRRGNSGGTIASTADAIAVDRRNPTEVPADEGDSTNLNSTG